MPKPTTDVTDFIFGFGRPQELHPWQQPVEEAQYFIEKFSRPGELIVDPFCGSATVPAAAKKMGRRWLATEIDRQHVLTARRRVAQTCG
jgi:site-specific DNA-methyltransferase (adenine-specific)